MARRPIPPTRLPLFASLATLALFALCTSAPPLTAYDLDATGRWTPSQTWNERAVHLMLLRGEGTPYHSKLLWFVGLGQHEQFYGGLWGWRSGDYTCSSYPDTSLLTALSFNVPADQMFCGGNNVLATGKAFIAGGTQAGTEYGIRKSYTFDQGASAASAWSARDSMEFARWYGTTTLLPTGDVLALSGSHYQHLEFFGGLANTETTPSDGVLPVLEATSYGRILRSTEEPACGRADSRMSRSSPSFARASARA